MRFLIGIVLLILSILGYLNLSRRYLKIPFELLLPIIFSVIGIIVFISGLLNILKVSSILICLIGIIFLIYDLKKRQFVIHKEFNVNMGIILFMFIYFTILCFSAHLEHYDNFTHWALLVKNMFIKDALPNFTDSLISFKGYQPGSACFIYYISLFIGKTESSMIIAQNYLLIAFYFSLLVFTDSKNIKISYLFKTLVVVGYLFIIFGNIPFNNLLVDSLISAIGVSIITVLFYYKDDFKKQFLCSLPLCIFLALIKNVGLVLVFFVCVYFVLYGFKNKNIKEGFKYAFLTGISTLFIFFVWLRHVSYVFTAGAISSNHTVSASHLVSRFSNNFDNVFEFGKIYFNHFVDIFNNFPNMFMLVLNLILIILIILLSKARKKLIKCLIISDLLYLIYYIVLGVMYIVSFEWEEIIILAGFDRYMLSIIFIIVFIVIIYVINVLKEYYDNTRMCFGILFFLIFVIIVVNCKYFMTTTGKYLIGQFAYKDSFSYKFDNALDTEFYLGDGNNYYYVYKSSYGESEGGYAKYISKYKLYGLRYKIVRDIQEIEDSVKVDSTEYNKVIILLEQTDEIQQYINKNNYNKIRNNYYIKLKQ